MKKIVLLLTMTVGLFACSTDNEEDMVQYGDDILQKTNAESLATLTTPSCFTSLTGSVHVDVSNGIGNPVVVFTPTVTGTVSATATFKVRVEIQPLSDCDDMNSITGTLLSFGPLGTVQNVVASPPDVSILPSSLPLCYKWRFVFEGITSPRRPAVCYSESVWYESPLF